MSNTNPNSRTTEPQSGLLSRLGLDKSELKSIKVAIMRRNVSEPNTTGPLLRNVDDPAQLVVHYRPDEGVRPIFDREDVVVNKITQEERMILSSPHPGTDKQPLHQIATSRSSSRSSRSSIDRTRSPPKQDKTRPTPQPHTSRDYRKDEYRGKEYYSSRYRRSKSNSRKAVYKTASSPPPRSTHTSRRSRTPYRSPERSRRRDRTPPAGSSKDKSPGRYYRDKQRRSRTPGGYKGPIVERRRTRSPPPKMSEKRRTPQYKGPPERRRSRSPKRSSRGRSRSHSPHHRRSRYSRSPHYHGDYRDRGDRYERSKRSRSRSPRRRHYTPERERERHSRRSPHDERMYQPPRIPNPYFEGAEFWIPDPMMQPRFIPRQMIPPGAFPYAPFRPGIPPMMRPRIPFRPRIVYNQPTRPKITPVAAAAAIESSSTVTTTSPPEVPKTNEETQQNVEIAGSSSKEPEHSTEENCENQEN